MTHELSENAVTQVALIGAGSMGHAIAQIMARAGLSVPMTDVNREFMQKGYDRINRSLEKFVEKRTLHQDEMDAVLARIGLPCRQDEAERCGGVGVE